MKSSTIILIVIILLSLIGLGIGLYFLLIREIKTKCQQLTDEASRRNYPIQYTNWVINPWTPNSVYQAMYLVIGSDILYCNPAEFQPFMNKMIPNFNDSTNIETTENVGFMFVKDTYTVISIRGTSNLEDVITDISYKLTANLPFKGSTGAMIHSGFAKAYSTIFPQIQKFIMSKNPSNTVLFVGHSLGAALSILFAYDFKVNYGKNVKFLASGSPKIGNQMLINDLNKADGWNTINVNDIVPKEPSEKDYVQIKDVHYIDFQLGSDLQNHSIIGYMDYMKNIISY